MRKVHCFIKVGLVWVSSGMRNLTLPRSLSNDVCCVGMARTYTMATTLVSCFRDRSCHVETNIMHRLK